jgi:hypothetical protein
MASYLAVLPIRQTICFPRSFSDRRQHDVTRTGIGPADSAFALVRPTGER